MKQGNQFYLEFQLTDEKDNPLNIDTILKVQFNIDRLTKTYDGLNNEVVYDNDKKLFKVWVTEKETFEFDRNVKMDARILFKGENDFRPIGGTEIEDAYWIDSLKEELLDD